MKKRIITIGLSVVLLVFLLACGTANVMSEADVARLCAEDPKCHAAPQWVQNQIQDGK